MPSKWIGRRNERLTVIDYVPGFRLEGQKKRGRLVCKCDCGKFTTFNSNHFKTIKSCGCYSQEQKIRTDNKVKTHGMTNTKVYKTWQTMRKRCSRPGYKYYSAIGVKVCARWEESFENFFADMGKPPSNEHSIDRIDPYGNYEPGNCRWATRSEQQRNRRCSK